MHCYDCPTVHVYELVKGVAGSVRVRAKDPLCEVCRRIWERTESVFREASGRAFQIIVMTLRFIGIRSSISTHCNLFVKGFEGPRVPMFRRPFQQLLCCVC